MVEHDETVKIYGKNNLQELASIISTINFHFHCNLHRADHNFIEVRDFA